MQLQPALGCDLLQRTGHLWELRPLSLEACTGQAMQSMLMQQTLARNVPNYEMQPLHSSGA
jgi:hypothetical protein